MATDAKEERARAAESRARYAEGEEAKAKAKLAAKAKPSRDRAKQARAAVTGSTDPGFGSALTVVLAMGLLYVIVSGMWQRFGPAWTTLLHGGAGSAPPAPVKPAGVTLPQGFPLPWQPSLS